MTRHLPKLWPLPIFVVSLLAIGLLGPSILAGSVVPATTGAPTAVPSVSLAEPSSTSTPVAPATPSLAATAAPRAMIVMQAPSSPSQEGGKSTKRVVLGYYVPYDATSWASFQARAGALDYVAGQWVTVDACGGIGSRDDRTLIAYANVQGVKVLPSLLTGSDWLNHRLLADRATSERYMGEIVRYVEEMSYPGFDLDMENIGAEDRDAYSSFVAQLADALHKNGKLLTLAIPAKTSDVRTGWAGPYDYAALGRHADFILLMTYDYSWASGPAGSIAPQEWVDKVAAYAASQMPPEKVLIGLAFYGYDWNTTLGGKARALIYPQAVALAKQYGTRIVTDGTSSSGSFSYTAKPGDTVPLPPSLPAIQHDIATRTPGQCLVQPPPVPPTSTPRPAPSPAPLQEHAVWLEDATSVAARLEIAVRHAVGGVGAWRLGQEDPQVWPTLDAYRSGK